MCMKKKISLIHSQNLAQVDYAYASQVPSGMKLLFLAGSCPLNCEGVVPHLYDYELQAKLCVENLKVVLEECGATLKDVVYTRVLVASSDQDNLVTAWDAIRAEFADHAVPSTLSGVTVLGYKNQLVELEAVAAVDSEND